MQGAKKLSVSQNALYNTVGTVIFCICQWATSALLVVHLSPADTAVANTGLLQLAISITNIFFAVSTYSMRTYQISDVNDKYSYGDYIGARFATAAIAVALCVGYTCVLGYDFKTVLCVSFYMLFKLNETFSDVLHAIDQKNYRMDYVGISFIIRGIVMVIAFAASLTVTGDLLISVIIMAVATVSVVAIYDIPKTRQFGDIKPRFNKKIIGTLLLVCLPTVISSAAFTAITSIPRQTLEAVQGTEALGYYGTVATPVLVVQIMATSIFNPMLTELAVLYNDGEVRKFVKKMLVNIALLGIITAAVLGGVALLGKFAVGIVFGKKFVPYTYLMYGIVGCTAMYTLSWLCTNTLIIMRRLKVCMIASIIALAFSFVAARPFISLFGMNGVSVDIILAYIIHISACAVVIFYNLKNKGKQN